MSDKPPNLPLYTALYALKRFSKPVQSDLLRDDSLATRYGISTSALAKLSDDIVVKQNELFDSFRNRLPKVSLSLSTERGAALDANLWFEEDGSGIAEIDQHRFRFPYVEMLAANVARREQLVQMYLAKNSLNRRDSANLLSLASKADFSDDDFLNVAGILSSSIEHFSDELNNKILARPFGAKDFLPDDVRYWDHLIAPLEGSATLSDYIGGEMFSERRRHLRENPERAIRSMSLSFSDPRLVPIDEFQSLSAELAIRMMEILLTVDDHFALLGGFEICADWITRDQRFADFGERFLDRLFGKMERLEAVTKLFGAAFVIATAHLKRNEILRGKPAFWRRVVAAAHASLIVRCLSRITVDAEEIFSSTIGFEGKHYLLSVFLDKYEQPRWRPEWITPIFLIPDAFGRALGAVLRLGQNHLVPPSWTSRIDAASTWVEEKHAGFLANYPAVTQGDRVERQASIDRLEDAPVFQEFSKDPSPENLAALSPIIYSIGVPDKFIGQIWETLQISLRQRAESNDAIMQTIIAVCVHIAAETQNVTLADQVSDLLLEGASILDEQRAVVETTYRIIECAGADSDRNSARKNLANRLENLAVILPSDHLTELLDTLEIIKEIDPELAPLLGRSLAAARLGISHFTLTPEA